MKEWSEIRKPERESRNKRNWAKFVALKILAGYKWAISPMLPPACRYVPTCSEYAMEAVERYGVLRGSLKTVARLFRCHPFAQGGYDPVVKEDRAQAWKSGPSAPGPAPEFLSGFRPCAHQHLKRNA